MGILAAAKAKLGHFILDHLVTQQVIQEWKASYIEDPLPYSRVEWPTHSNPPSPQPAERHTDAIDERAVNAAIKAQGLKVVRGRALDIPADYVAPGKLFPWYKEHINRIMEQDTVQMSAINLQEELLKRLDEGERG